MIITLSGNDGSGKTAIVKKIKDYYAEKNAEIIFVEEFNYFVISFFKKLLGVKRVQSQQILLQEKDSRSVLKIIFPYIVWFDLIIEHFYLKIFHRNKLIFKDRQAYDFLITWIEQGISNRFIYYIYGHFPKADMAFYIYVDPLIAHERKVLQYGDLAKKLSFYVEKTKMYDVFFDKKNVLKVDNNQDISATVFRIISYINLRERFLKLKTIAISGIDGAGKTTTINNLIKLTDGLNLKTKTIHFYYNYIILKLFKKIKNNVIATESLHQKSIENEIRTVERGKGKFWKWFVLLDAFIQYWFVKMFYSRRIIIFDRYFHDFLVSFDFINVSYNRSFLLKIFPKVDRYFLQIADYKILYERKPEHTLEFFEKCHGSYSKLAMDQDLIVLDSTFNNEDEIVKIIIDNI